MGGGGVNREVGRGPLFCTFLFLHPSLTGLARPQGSRSLDRATATHFRSIEVSRVKSGKGSMCVREPQCIFWPKSDNIR